MDLMWHIVWMNEWFNVPNNMDEYMVWHIIVAAMCWREIQIWIIVENYLKQCQFA
jgi:hypothetical protein